MLAVFLRENESSLLQIVYFVCDFIHKSYIFSNVYIFPLINNF